MTIGEAIRRVDALKPNRFTPEQKRLWLATLEGQIYNEIVLTHECADRVQKPEIDEFSDDDVELIAPFPYDEVYVLWLQSQIDLGNMEITKYNNTKTLFNNTYLTLRDYWTSKYMPIQKAKAFRYTRGHHCELLTKPF